MNKSDVKQCRITGTHVISFLLACFIVSLGLSLIDQDLEPPRLLIAGSQTNLDKIKATVDALHLENIAVSKVVPSETRLSDTLVHFFAIFIALSFSASAVFFFHKFICRWLETEAHL